MISMYDQLKSFIRAMSSTPFVINNPSYDETSASCSNSEDLHMENDGRLERKLCQLTSENQILRAKIEMLRRIFGEEVQTLFQTTEQSSMVCPPCDQSTTVNLHLESSPITDLIY